MASHKNHHLNVIEEFFVSSISKLITYFIDNSTLGTKSHSVICLLSGSEHIYWILDLGVSVRCTQYGFVDWNGLQECMDNFSFEVGRSGQHILVGLKKKVK